VAGKKGRTDSELGALTSAVQTKKSLGVREDITGIDLESSGLQLDGLRGQQRLGKRQNMRKDLSKHQWMENWGKKKHKDAQFLLDEGVA